jgi:hypothetical protein
VRVRAHLAAAIGECEARWGVGRVEVAAQCEYLGTGCRLGWTSAQSECMAPWHSTSDQAADVVEAHAGGGAAG